MRAELRINQICDSVYKLVCDSMTILSAFYIPLHIVTESLFGFLK